MKKLLGCALAAMSVLGLAAVAQQQDFSKVEIKAQKVADGVYMLSGAGGNIGVRSAGSQDPGRAQRDHR